MKFKLTDIARVRNEERFNQPIYFDGMTCNKIYPTDIDAITEYHDKLYIIMEVKCVETKLNRGQTTALVRLADTIQETGKTAVLFICRHDVPPAKPIFLKDTVVNEIYYKGHWYNLSPRTALEAWEYAINWAKQKEERGEL